jgi:hypothetical protein
VTAWFRPSAGKGGDPFYLRWPSGPQRWDGSRSFRQYGGTCSCFVQVWSGFPELVGVVEVSTGGGIRCFNLLLHRLKGVKLCVVRCCGVVIVACVAVGGDRTFVFSFSSICLRQLVHLAIGCRGTLNVSDVVRSDSNHWLVQHFKSFPFSISAVGASASACRRSLVSSWRREGRRRLQNLKDFAL